MDIIVYETGNRRIFYDSIRRITEREHDVIMLDSHGYVFYFDKNIIEKIEIKVGVQDGKEVNQ